MDRAVVNRFTMSFPVEMLVRACVDQVCQIAIFGPLTAATATRSRDHRHVAAAILSYTTARTGGRAASTGTHKMDVNDIPLNTSPRNSQQYARKLKLPRRAWMPSSAPLCVARCAGVQATHSAVILRARESIDFCIFDMSQINDLGPAKTWNSNRFTNSEEPRACAASRRIATCARFHPSRLAEDGERLRMTAALLAAVSALRSGMKNAAPRSGRGGAILSPDKPSAPADRWRDPRRSPTARFFPPATPSQNPTLQVPVRSTARQAGW
jgi:hypothetical protein